MKSIITTLIILGAALFFGFILGCARPPISGEQSSGRSAYLNNCGVCHRRPKPDSNTDEQWRKIMREHEDKASLDKNILKQVSDYLQAGN
ncbi:MAG: hypothetical protein V3V99_00950 [candidate division Zixibacteria bacterium]